MYTHSERTMQHKISWRSETDSALTARQRSWSCFLRFSYSSWILFLCSLSPAFHGGHFIRHWSGPHDTFSILARWSLIHDSTLRCIASILSSSFFQLFFFLRTTNSVVISMIPCVKETVILMGCYFGKSICVYAHKSQPPSGWWYWCRVSCPCPCRGSRSRSRSALPVLNLWGDFPILPLQRLFSKPYDFLRVGFLFSSILFLQRELSF